jgi:methylenetetrahydrofolate dehydrogenase (NADP+)/methenyltetrahydrofolate cyclohydrolase
LIDAVSSLREDADVSGILVQLPLPGHLNVDEAIEAIGPLKDVDGLHPTNIARLNNCEKGFLPCTPLGIMHILKDTPLEGRKVTIIGRSKLVGQPIQTLIK